MSETPKLHLICGPMFAGKSTFLIHNAKILIDNGVKQDEIMMVNHSFDKRYTDESNICTHDGLKMKSESFINLCELTSIINSNIEAQVDKIKYIFIDEGQFFNDLYDEVKKLLCKYKKTIYIGGLDGDFERKKFGQILDLIPLCDKVTKMTSLCSLCKNGTAGIFSKRITKEREQTVVGSSNYIPVCRSCFEQPKK